MKFPITNAMADQVSALPQHPKASNEFDGGQMFLSQNQSSRSKRAPAAVVFPVVGILVSAGLATALGNGVVATAKAQGAQLGGGAQGVGSGGTSGGTAAPKGQGAGGTTAGPSATVGGEGTTLGPGPVNQNRFGRGVTPVEPTVATNAADLSRYLRGDRRDADPLLDRCSGHAQRVLKAKERVASQNLQLLNTATDYLASTFDRKWQKTAVYLLANYQEELEKRRPDATLAGSYLALVSAGPITEDTVARANAILCVTTSAKTARAIAMNAESQRQRAKK